MGEKDITEKLLEDYPDVFADIFNVLLFDGEKLIKEDIRITVTLVAVFEVFTKKH